MNTFNIPSQLAACLSWRPLQGSTQSGGHYLVMPQSGCVSNQITRGRELARSDGDKKWPMRWKYADTCCLYEERLMPYESGC